MLITVGFFILEITGGVLRQFDGSSVAVVRDYGLHHYQPTRNFMRGITFEYPLKPLLLLHFVRQRFSIYFQCFYYFVKIFNH